MKLYRFKFYEQKSQILDYYKTSITGEQDKWKGKINELKHHFSSIEAELVEKQKKEMEVLRTKMESSIPENPKPSSAILNFKAVQQVLAKQGKFAEAKEAKEKAKKLEMQEKKKWSQSRREKIAIQEAQLMQKHNKERQAHKERTALALSELKQERDKKLEFLKRSYKKEISKLSNENLSNAMKTTTASKTSF